MYMKLDFFFSIFNDFRVSTFSHSYTFRTSLHDLGISGMADRTDRTSSTFCTIHDAKTLGNMGSHRFEIVHSFTLYHRTRTSRRERNEIRTGQKWNRHTDRSRYFSFDARRRYPTKSSVCREKHYRTISRKTTQRSSLTRHFCWKTIYDCTPLI